MVLCFFPRLRHFHYYTAWRRIASCLSEKRANNQLATDCRHLESLSEQSTRVPLSLPLSLGRRTRSGQTHTSRRGLDNVYVWRRWPVTSLLLAYQLRSLSTSHTALARWRVCFRLVPTTISDVSRQFWEMWPWRVYTHRPTLKSLHATISVLPLDVSMVPPF